MVDQHDDAVRYARRWIEYRQRHDRIPGLVLGVRVGDDQVVEDAHGLADLTGGTVMTPQHRFPVASHSKMFTAAAVLQLVQQGRLRLDDAVGDHVEELGRAAPEVRDLTVRSLLAHASGLVRDGGRAGVWQFVEAFPSSRELLDEVVATPLVTAPLARFKYSNVGYGLLGVVVERVTGSSLRQHLDDHVFGPLGMAASSLVTDAVEADGLAVGHSQARYGLSRVPVAPTVTQSFAPAAGVVTTARDLCSFGAAHFVGDERLLTDTTKREMHHPHWLVGGAGMHYGLGVTVEEIDGERVVGHGGAFPGFRTATRIAPKAKIVVSVLTNAIDAAAETLAVGVMALLLGTRQQPTDDEVRDPAALQRFEGRFFDPWGVLDVAVLGGRLRGLSPDLDLPLASASSLEVVGDDTLLVADDNGYGSPGERLRYVREADGTLDHVDRSGARHYPWARFAGAFPDVPTSIESATAQSSSASSSAANRISPS